MFHRSGHLAGQPRGFAFVTYKKRQDALKAQEQLHGRLVGCRNLSVKWAKNTTNVRIHWHHDNSSKTISPKLSKQRFLQDRPKKFMRGMK